MNKVSGHAVHGRSGEGVQVVAGPRWVYVPYRVLVTLAAFLALLQSVLAGQFLSGVFGALQWHQNVAALIDMLLIAAAPTAILIRWPGRGPWWPILAPLALLVLTSIQNWAGFNRVLSLHIPLGVLILICIAPLTIWAWLPRGGRDHEGRA